MADGDPIVNSDDAKSSVAAALDSVTIINDIVNNTDAVEGKTTAEKAYDADRNYRHIEIMKDKTLIVKMKDKTWFWSTATASEKTTLTNAISAGAAYYNANK